jgi:putative oxidoreductase
MNRQPFRSAAARIDPLETRFVAIENTLHAVLVRHGITALRITVGMVFLGFGLLKFFPGVSPAENLAITTVDRLTFGLVPGEVGLVAIATLECFIGISLLANRWMRLAVWLLAVQLVGVLAPIVLLTGRLFSGPHHAPTLEGQYVLKDIILVAAGLVIAAGTFRGGRLVRDEPQPARGATSRPETPDAGRQRAWPSATATVTVTHRGSGSQLMQSVNGTRPLTANLPGPSSAAGTQRHKPGEQTDQVTVLSRPLSLLAGLAANADPARHDGCR